MLRKLVVLSLLLLAGASCSQIIGPRSVHVDRHAYIEALNQSWKEQLLYNLVKLRYGEPPTFLDVTSITQTYKLDTGAAAEYDLGWQFSKPGSQLATTVGGGNAGTTITTPTFPIPSNTLKLGGSVLYDVNPTITYTPISGEALKNAMVAPISTIDLFKALETGGEVDIFLPLCVSSINTLRNRSAGNPDAPKSNNPGNPLFFDLVRTWKCLRENGAIHVSIKKIKEPKETSQPDNDTSKALPSLQDKLADNLVKFTSALVKKQKDKDDEEVETVVISLDKGLDPLDVNTALKESGVDSAATRKKIAEDVRKFKTLLGLPSVDLNSASEPELNKAFSTALKKEQSVDHALFQKINKGRPYKSLDDLKKADFTKDFTKDQIESLKGYLSVGDEFQLVPGSPPQRAQGQSFEKIYVSTRSVSQTLIHLSKYITVPQEDEGRVNPGYKVKEPGITLHKIEIKCENYSARDAFAGVKYHDHWFWINSDHLDSKTVFSDMIEIFTMLEPGKATTQGPILTLPVR
jgi:hypothetical protein